MKRQHYSVFLALATSLMGLAVPLHGQFEFVYLYSNQTPNFVNGYSVNFNTGAPTLIPANFPGNLNVTSAAASPNGKFLYVAAPQYFLDATPNLILAYTIDPATGVLTPVPGSPYANDILAGVAAIAVDPTGRFVYVANNGNTAMSVFTIDSSTGALTLVQQLPGQASNPNFLGAIGLTTDPAGKFLYVADGGANVFVFAIDPNAGTLTPVPGSPFTQPSGEAPVAVLIHPSGNFAYVVEAGQIYVPGPFEVAGYAIDPNTGALTTPLPGSPAVVGGLSTFAAAMDPSASSSTCRPAVLRPLH